MRPMKKTEAIELLDGSPTSVALAVGVSVAAVCKWPDELPPRIADRVQAALWRRMLRTPHAPQTPKKEVANV